MKPWIETAVPACQCPLCGCRLDVASGEGATPHPGDGSVCLKCASPLVFNDDMSLRVMTAGEFDRLDFPVKTKLRRYMAAVRQIDRTKIRG